MKSKGKYYIRIGRPGIVPLWADPSLDEPLTSKWLAVKVEAMTLTVSAERMLFSIAGPLERMGFSYSMAAGGILSCSKKLATAWSNSTTL